MEFPELGTHCAVTSCCQLDFLPFTCDACHKVFCKDHKTYDQHNCSEAYTKDVRVPVCPLCDQPVPIARGDDPNIKVEQHIQNDCKSDKAKAMYTNRCSFPGCRKKELVRVTCNTCHKTFCLKHRFETDHSCEGHPNRLGTRAGSSGATPPARRVNKKPQATTLAQIGAELDRERQRRMQQPREPRPHLTSTPSTGQRTDLQTRHLTEDEALAIAMAASMNDPSPHQAPPPTTSPHQPPPPPTTSPHQPPPPPTTSPPSARSYDEDEALARAIAASLNDEQPKPARRHTTSHRAQQNKDNTCTIA